MGKLVLEQIVTCSICGEKLYLHEGQYDHAGKCYCDYCFHTYVQLCTYCGKYHNINQLKQDNFDHYACNDCYNNVTVCTDCGKFMINSENIFYAEYEPYCLECYKNHSIKIHDYSHKPKPIFYGYDSRCRFGVEVEIDEGGYSTQNASEVLKTMNSSIDDKIYIKEDGSLDDGFEIVSHPATLNQHLTVFNWKKCLGKCEKLGYTSHDADSCGLHVHISKIAFGMSELEQDLNITKLLLITEMHWDKLVIFSRRNDYQLNKWACRYGLIPEDRILNNAKYSDRYHAVNLQNEHTVEIRIFRGTLNYTTFIATLQFCQLLVNLVNLTDIKDLHKLTWEYITESAKDYNYKELTEYFQKRKLV